ncbi:MAG: preprotein translocase subunit SecE [Chromatiales bacterium]
MAAFYFYSDQSLLLRVVGLLAVGGVAGTLALQTAQGRDVWGFFKEAQIEVRKVVWPTRQETTRMTLIVIAMVIAMAAILWLLDAMLAWLVQWLTGQRG